MLKTILGSAIGGLTAGAVALGVSAYARPAAPVMGADPSNPYAMTVAYPGAQGAAAQPGYYYAAQPAYYAPRLASDMVTMPAPRTRTVARPVAARQRVVSRDEVAATRERAVSRDDDRREDRSWGKTAMIIGGGAGGGAGIGGLIGGKKGALIGAAIGGGAATIYESTKR